MGQAGQQRARALYDWATVIGQYEALWTQLGELRKAQAPALKAMPYPWPARMDPFHAFANYPTQTLTPQTVLGLVDADAAKAIERLASYRNLAMVCFAKEVLPTEQEVQTVLTAAATPKTAQDLITAIAPQRQAVVFKALVWLVKMGGVESGRFGPVIAR